MHTVGREIGRETLKNAKKEKCTSLDLEYGKKTENNGKGKMHTVGTEVWQEN